MTPITLDDVTLIRSKRKTVGIQVSPENRIVLRAPHRLSKAYLGVFLEKQQAWIQRHLKKNELAPKKLAHTYEDGDIFYFLGVPYPLTITMASKKHVCIKDDILEVSLKAISLDTVKKSINYWYLTHAKDIITDRVMTYAAEMNVSPNTIRFRSQKTRWGSCSSKGNLNFNRALIKAPLTIIDYVVVHPITIKTTLIDTDVI